MKIITVSHIRVIQLWDSRCERLRVVRHPEEVLSKLFYFGSGWVLAGVEISYLILVCYAAILLDII